MMNQAGQSKRAQEMEIMNGGPVNWLSWTAQQGGGAMRSKKSLFGALAVLPLMGLLSFSGCSEVLPATLQEKLATTGNEEDHLAAAMLYQNKARELEAEAVKYETAASKTGPNDSKGFQHAALLNAAQQKRADAKEMQELYVTHFKEAQSLHGKAQPQ
jgi:hypothetical protein